MLPPAPGRLSTTTDWPNDSVNCCDRTRATMSVPPPGAYGTINRSGRDGYDCASPSPALRMALSNRKPPSVRIFTILPPGIFDVEPRDLSRLIVVSTSFHENLSV